jgi:hypothetical protein
MMAIIKHTIDKHGIPVVYHSITKVEMKRGGELGIFVDSYISKDTYERNLSPVASGVYRFFAGDWPDEWADGKMLNPTGLYALLKTKTDFENGIDDIEVPVDEPVVAPVEGETL